MACTSVAGHALVGLRAEPGFRWRSFTLSCAIHSSIVLLLASVSAVVSEPRRVARRTVYLLAPPLQPEPAQRRAPSRNLPAPLAKRLEVPPPRGIAAPEPKKTPEIKFPEPPAPRPQQIREPRLLAEEPRLPAPKPAIRTGMFSSAAAPAPATTVHAPIVQTGGFGDPNGAAINDRTEKAQLIAQLGSFDLPGGPGQGNGSGGHRGARGTVASAGFSGGTATPAAGAAKGALRQGSFGDWRPAADHAAPRARPAEESPIQPVEILFKPRPAYTDEARAQRLEGEVWLKVLFSASGQIRVLSVTRSLGHGLDETAVSAAEQIRFKPAQREGKPVDYASTVRIVFQLAY